MPAASGPAAFAGAPGGAEPEPQPGAIQPHGLLLVLHPATLEVLQVAGDGTLLGPNVTPRPGQDLGSLFPPGPLAQIRQLLDQPPETELHAAEIALPGATRLDITVQHGEAGVLLEIERRPQDPPDGADGPLPAVAAMAARLEGAGSVATLCQAAVEELRGFVRFDSVALHRFAPDDGSIVVAEARAPGAPPGPAPADPAVAAPRQALEREFQGWSRLVPDTARAPAPLEPPLSPLTGAPTDLSLSRLRSPPPAQLEDLARIGVRAAMSVALQRDGRLWGLFACHAATPRSLPLARRAACELFAQIFALQLEAASQAEIHAEAQRLAAHEKRLVAALAAAPSLAAGLAADLAGLRAFLGASGVAVLAGDEVAAEGAVPDEAVLRGVRDALAGGAGVVALNDLADGWPLAHRFGPAETGVLRLSLPAGEAILWFRSGLAGARRWAPITVEAADALRVALLESVLHRMEEVAQERARARQRQDLLLGELDHRVRAMLARLHGLAGPGGAGAPELEALLAGLHARLRAMAQAHGLLAAGRWDGISLRGLAEEQLRPHGGRIAIEGPELRLLPRAALSLGLALHELAANAARHGALARPTGHVRLGWRVEARRLRLDWVEEGGPPVLPPARRGFGSLVIERGLAGALGGDTRLVFDHEGLRWRASLPLAAVAAPGAAPGAAPLAPTAPRLEGVRVLVVEDSAFVAMAMADGLEAAGAEVLGPVARLEEAQAIIADSLPDAALLDIDLDGVPVFPVADLLTERGVPIVFTTGYEPRLVLPPRYARAAVLPKPCRGDEAAAAVRLALAER